MTPFEEAAQSGGPRHTWPHTLQPHSGSCKRKGDVSDTNSGYSVGSLFCVCAQALPAPLLELEETQRKEAGTPEPDNSESDDSQISEDSLAEKGAQKPTGQPRTQLPHQRLWPQPGQSTSLWEGFTTSSGSRPFTLAHRSVSLDSLIDAEEEPGDHWQGKPFFGSTDEMPTETFWRLQAPFCLQGPGGSMQAWFHQSQKSPKARCHLASEQFILPGTPGAAAL